RVPRRLRLGGELRRRLAGVEQPRRRTGETPGAEVPRAAGGGDDGGGGGDGGVDRDAARAKLEAMIGEDGMPEEMVNCLVDAALDTFDDADLESVLDGGDPSQAAEDAFTEKAIECAG
ncbi:MAG: hypothetical protein ACO27U_05920, partial [Ilumatobacteraceae bacterium]